MSASAPTPPLGGVIDRHGEADRVTEFLLNVLRAGRTRIVVLSGRRASGKTELLRRWVIPMLRAAREARRYDVLYGDCAPAFPTSFDGPDGPRAFEEVVARQSILVVDSFTNVLDLPAEERRETLDRLFGRVQRSNAGTLVILVTDSRRLTSVYALGSYDPEIRDAVFEVGSVEIGDGITQLAAVQPESVATCKVEVLRSLKEDTAALEPHGEVTFDLIRLVDAHFRQFRRQSGTRLVEVDHYKAWGGLKGMIRQHLEASLADLAAGGRSDLARVLLERFAEAEARGSDATSEDLAARFAVGPDEPRAVLNRLAAMGLLRQRSGGRYELAPPQLAAIIAEETAARAPQVQRVQYIVDQGVRGWQELGSLLPPDHFEEVHRARTDLVLDHAQLRFLLQCALRQPDGGSGAGPARYWLLRVAGRTDGIDILLSALLDADAAARERAAALLASFPEPEVRDRLSILALTDTQPAVRAAAVSSLGAMQNADLLEKFVREARDPKSANRVAAIEALRIFPQESVPGVLQCLVNDPQEERSVREHAIRVLGKLDTVPSVSALLAIALHDKDKEDREAAAHALALITDASLNRHVLSHLGPPSSAFLRRRLRVLGAIVVSGLVVAGFLTVLFPVLFLVGLAALIPARILLVRLQADESSRSHVRRASAVGALGIALVLLSAGTLVFWIRGLAHLLVGEWRRAGQLFALEVAAILVIAFGVTFSDPFWGAFIPYLYMALGAGMFLASYAFDVVPALLTTILLRDTARALARRTVVVRHVLASPAAKVLFDALRDPDARQVAWARDALVVAKTDDTVGPVTKLWDSADMGWRRFVASVLCRRPTERSLEALDRLRQDLGTRGKLELGKARLGFWLTRPPRIAWGLVIVVALPLGKLTWHGIRVLENPAWSQIVSLNRVPLPIPWHAEAEEKKLDSQLVAIVEILGDHYPTESAKILLHRLQKRTDAGGRPTVHAAIARALVHIQDSMSVGLGLKDTLTVRSIRAELLSQAEDFRRLLQDQDSNTATASLAVLGGMARARDDRLADSAVALLEHFLLSRAADSAYVAPEGAISAIGSARRDRAEPALRRLMTALRGPELAGVIGGWLQRLGSCDLNHDGGCDAIDNALSLVKRDPTLEYGYDALLEQYLLQKRYAEAESALVALKTQYPLSLWVPRTLALLYHENSEAHYRQCPSGAAFDCSYDQMRVIRQWDAYRALRDSSAADYLRIEADFAEVALSAKQYGELQAVAQGPLARTNEPVYRFNLALFVYLGHVVRRDADSAEAALSRLDQEIGKLPLRYYNNWIYSGTVEFIHRSDLPDRLKQALRSLCLAGPWPSKADRDALVRGNREALQELRQ